MGNADMYFSMIGRMEYQIDNMQKGASWLNGGWAGGTEPLKGTDKVLWTVDQATVNVAELKRGFANVMSSVVEVTGALDPTESIRYREEYKEKVVRAESEYDESMARFLSHTPKRVRAGGVRHGCECPKTMCGTRACKCVQKGNQCSLHCHCVGGPTCQSPFKHAKSDTSSSSSSSGVGPSPYLRTGDGEPRNSYANQCIDTVLFFSLLFFFFLRLFIFLLGIQYTTTRRGTSSCFYGPHTCCACCKRRCDCLHKS
jgi:hypothetical protein